MKNAIIAAIVAALVSSGATLAATKMSGRAIAKHSIPANRLTAAAVDSFTAQATPRATAAAVTSTLDYEQTEVPVVAQDSVTVKCPTGDVAIAGGYGWTRGNGPIASSWHLDDGSGWRVVIGDTTGAPNDGGGPARIAVYVTCEPSTP